MLTHIVVMLILNKNETKKKIERYCRNEWPYVHVHVYKFMTVKQTNIFSSSSF